MAFERHRTAWSESATPDFRKRAMCAATAEISRTQVWQLVHHGASLEDGRRVDAGLVRSVLTEELAAIERELGTEAFRAARFPLAAELFLELVTAEELAEFLTLTAYDHV